MSQKRFKPKYLLLSAPTLKYSRSTHEQSFNVKSFEVPSIFKPQSILKVPKQKSSSIKDGLSKQMGSISEELNQTMQIIVLQQKRNNTLKLLNEILQRENREAEQREKRQIKPKLQKEKKELDKQDYQIDQILQKYNEEVARIAGLREQVNSARTERVVYSALFKKIEREIKYYETLYKEMIVKTELRGVEKSQQNAINMNKNQVQAIDENDIKDDSALQSRISTHFEAIHKFFMTNPDKVAKSQFMKTSERIDPTLFLKQKIEEMESKVDIIVKRAQCQSPQEVFDYYQSVKRNNAEMTNQIQEFQWDMEEIEEQMQRIRLQRRNSEITDQKHMKKLTNLLPSQRKLRSYRHIKTNSEEVIIETPTQIFNKLLQAAQINKNHKTIVDMMGELQENLFGEGSVKGEKSEHCLEGILLKMDKFQNCEKIFSKRQFENEYLKEVSKQKKGLKIKR